MNACLIKIFGKAGPKQLAYDHLLAIRDPRLLGDNHVISGQDTVRKGINISQLITFLNKSEKLFVERVVQGFVPVAHGLEVSIAQVSMTLISMKCQYRLAIFLYGCTGKDGRLIG